MCGNRFWPKPNGLRPDTPPNVPLIPKGRPPGTLPPCHPCEITGNLTLRRGTESAPPALCLIGDTKKPSPTRGDGQT